MLTDQVYLETSLLSLQKCMRSIKGFGPLTQILTHFSGKACHLGSRNGKTDEEDVTIVSPLIVDSRRSLTQFEEICEWRDRRDLTPNPVPTCSQVANSYKLKEFPKEQWTQLWIQIDE